MWAELVVDLETRWMEGSKASRSLAQLQMDAGMAVRSVVGTQGSPLAYDPSAAAEGAAPLQIQHAEGTCKTCLVGAAPAETCTAEDAQGRDEAASEASHGFAAAVASAAAEIHWARRGLAWPWQQTTQRACPLCARC